MVEPESANSVGGVSDAQMGLACIGALAAAVTAYALATQGHHKPGTILWATLAAGFCPVILYCLGTLFVIWRRTLRHQRDEAREYAKEMETYTAELERFVDRYEIAHQFFWDTFWGKEFLLPPDGSRAGMYNQDLRPVEEIEAECRTKVENFVRQMERLGSDPEQLGQELIGGLALLDRRDEGYGDDHRRRIWGNMSAMSGNIRAAGGRDRPMRPAKPQPEKPEMDQ